MEDDDQSPSVELPGGFPNGKEQNQSQHQQQQQQLWTDPGLQHEGESKQSSSSFSRLPRNVIER